MKRKKRLRMWCNKSSCGPKETEAGNCSVIPTRSNGFFLSAVLSNLSTQLLKHEEDLSELLIAQLKPFILMSLPFPELYRYLYLVGQETGFVFGLQKVGFPSESVTARGSQLIFNCF